MKLALTLDGVERSIEILAPAPECRYRMDGAADMAADVETPEPGVYSILVDGRSFDARVEEAPGMLIVVIEGQRFEIEVRDPRRRSRRPGSRAGEGRNEIAAPMPGKVVRVLVAPGETVQAGQGLVVVEAMKMQNEMKSPRDGVVAAVHAREGATVAAGETLVMLA